MTWNQCKTVAITLNFSFFLICYILYFSLLLILLIVARNSSKCEAYRITDFTYTLYMHYRAYIYIYTIISRYLARHHHHHHIHDRFFIHLYIIYTIYFFFFTLPQFLMLRDTYPFFEYIIKLCPYEYI